MTTVIKVTKVTKNLKYENIDGKRRFCIEPSRRGTKKISDPEQLRIFAERQKRLPELWHSMGVVSWKKLNGIE